MKTVYQKQLIHGFGLLFFVGLSCFTHPANGQEWARKMFTEFVHDFGTVSKEEQPVYKFEITNLYREDIRIRGVYSSCGCTTPTLSTNLLKSREKAYVVCRYNTHLFDGFKQATVTVQFDAPFYGEVQLTVRGNIVRGISFSPKELDFGTATINALPPMTTTISRSQSNSFQIVDVKSTYPHVGVQLKEKYRNYNGTAYDMVVSLKDSVPLGFTQGELLVVGIDGGQRIEMPITFSGKVVSPLRISPETLTLSSIKQGEKITRKIICKADTPFRITDVTCSTSSFRVRADSSQRKTHVVEVSYVGNEPIGRHEWQLEFQTDLVGASTTTMKAIVEVVDSGKPAAEDVASNDGSE